jgi:hypothetical protein
MRAELRAIQLDIMCCQLSNMAAKAAIEHWLEQEDDALRGGDKERARKCERFIDIARDRIKQNDRLREQLEQEFIEKGGE